MSDAHPLSNALGRWPRELNYASLPDEEFVRLLADADAELRAKYPDWARLAVARDAVAEALRPDLTKVTPFEYGEACHLVARHSELARHWREQAPAPATEASPPAQPDPDKVQAIAEAFEKMRRMYGAEFDALQPVMEVVAKAVTPNFAEGRISLFEFCELCFCAAKHSSFCAEVRPKFLLEAAVPASDRKM